MTIVNQKPKTYEDVLKEIFNAREEIKLKIVKSRAQDLAVKEILRTPEEKIIEELKRRLLKGEKFSVPYVARKYRVDPVKANELLIKVTLHECYEWDGLEIHMFMKEWKSCVCFKDQES